MLFKISETQDVDFGDIDKSFFLIGLLNEFMNRFQSAGDRYFGELSWKQCFLLICIQFFREPPMLAEVAEMLGCSHQNVKQMVLRLEKLGYVSIKTDEKDRRKLRVCLNQKAQEFSQANEQISQEFMNGMFSGIEEKDIETTISTIMRMDKWLKLSHFSDGKKL